MAAQLLAHYGYLAVFVGCLLEGETILVLAGFAAHQGYLSFLTVVLIAMLSGWLGDQTFFFLGRHYGTLLLKRFPDWSRRAQRVTALLQRYHAGVIVLVRFLYGLRIVGPVVIGMSAVPARRFVLFNLLGAALWAPLIAGTGYLFGQAMQWLFVDLKHYEEAALLGLVALAVLVGLFRHFRRRRSAQRPSDQA